MGDTTLKKILSRPLRLLGAALLTAAMPLAITTSLMPTSVLAQDLKGGTLRVAIQADMTNFDPQQFSTVNFFLIKNLYDSLVEYTPDGEAIPSLATEWSIAEDSKSVTVKLRDDVKFSASGNPFT